MLFLRSSTTDAAVNLATEQWLQEQALPPVFFLYQNAPAVIVGKYQNVYAETDPAALRRDHYNVNTTSRLNGGQREYYGWINGEAYWLPKAFIDTVENWYQMPMEEQLAEHSVSFYERVYAQASPTERRKLELLYPEIRDPQRVSEYCREIRITAGLAPDDMPRITLEQAKELCREVQEEIENDYQAQLSELIARLNEITGGPDWVGGSGFPTSIYYLDEGKTAGISIIHLGLGLVMYYGGDGTKTVLMSPSPTVQP